MNRIINIDTQMKAIAEMRKVAVSEEGIALMQNKALFVTYKMEHIKLGAANILKQEMLSLGGEAAVARGIVNGKTELSDAILMGSIDKLLKLVEKLKRQNYFGLSAIALQLEDHLSAFIKPENCLINCRGKILSAKKLNIMGILNITEDSFSDGGDYLDVNKAVDFALKMIEDGADLIDIGGESTRPGAQPVEASEEIRKVCPVIEKLRLKTNVPISIDTYKSETAAAALNAGATIINDISSLTFDNNMVSLLSRYRDLPVILMHIKGIPQNMQINPCYDDVMKEIITFFEERINFCQENGIEKERLIIDPGIGFGKRLEDNLTILNRLNELKCFGVPVMVGASRKSFINGIYSSTVKERIEGTLAATAQAFFNKISLIRVHDVRENYNFLKVLTAIREVE